MATRNTIAFAAIIENKVSGELAKIKRDFDQTHQSKGFQSLVMGVGMGAGLMAFNALSGAVNQAIGFLQGSVGAASDLNETITKSQQIFGANSKEIEAWAGTMASSFGQSKKDALDMASTFAGLFQTVGLTTDDAAAKAQRLVELGSDLASFFNTDVQQAVGALRSGLAGESEPLRRFNVFLTESTLAAKAAEMGLTKLGGKLTEQQKITARYAIIMEQTSAAQGDFARTGEGLANQQRKLDAELANVSATIGRELLPVALELVKAFRGIVKEIPAALDQLKLFYAFLSDPGGDWKGTKELERLAEWLEIDNLNTETWATAVETVSAKLADLAESATTGKEAFAQFNPVLENTQSWDRFSEIAGGTVDYVDSKMDDLARSFDGTMENARIAVIKGAAGIKTGSEQIVASATYVVTEYERAFLTKFMATWETARKAARDGAVATVKAAADGIRSARSNIDAALDTLATDVANAMTSTAEIGRLGGLLTGKQLANALASGDKGVVASANYVVALIEARLDDLTEGAYTRGKRAAAALAAGFAQTLPPLLRSELGDVIKDARYYEDLMKSFKPASADTRLLTSSMADLAKSSGGAGGASESVAKLKVQVKEAVANIKSAVSAIREFVAASVAGVDFSPKLISVADAAKRVEAVMGRVQTAISRLRVGSTATLDAVKTAFDRLRSVAADYFDAVHRQNLRLIEEARAVAMGQYDAQASAINAEVEAYRQKLEEKRLARQEEQLKEALATAETPEDVKRATEALNDFYDDMALRRLEAAAQAQLTELEQRRQADNTMYDQQVEAENRRYEAQKAAFDRLVELLAGSLETMRGLWESKNKDILAYLGSLVGEYGAAGQALFDAFMAAFQGGGGGIPMAPGTVGGTAKNVTSPGVLDQADIDALKRYIGNLSAIDNRTAEQERKLADYTARLEDYTARLEGRAAGGTVLAGQPYLVGEKGPELFVPAQNGSIVPEGSGGQPVVIQLQVDGRTLAEIVDRNLFYKYRLASATATV